MVGKEGSIGGKGPWTDAEKITLRNTLELRRIQSEAPQVVLDPGVEYFKLVSADRLAKGVWYRKGEINEFVLAPPTNLDKETLSRVCRAELVLQRKFPLVNFDFRFSDLSPEEKAELQKNGYKLISRVEKDAPHNPQ